MRIAFDLLVVLFAALTSTLSTTEIERVTRGTVKTVPYKGSVTTIYA